MTARLSRAFLLRTNGPTTPVSSEQETFCRRITWEIISPYQNLHKMLLLLLSLTFCWRKIVNRICHEQSSGRQPHHRQLQDRVVRRQRSRQKAQQQQDEGKQQEGHYCDGQEESTSKKIQLQQVKSKNKNHRRQRDSTFPSTLLACLLPSLLINVSGSHLTIALVSAEPSLSSSSSSSSQRSSPSSYVSPPANSTLSGGGSTSATKVDGPYFSSSVHSSSHSGGERRLSPRTVTTKYGSLRGVTLSLPNRSLPPVETFLGK